MKKIAPNMYNSLKDIVQPKKEGVKRGINQFAFTSYTSVDVF